jgi:hypothetical protein
MAQFTSLTDVIADRLDRNTVIVSWNFRGASEFNKINLYDSFVVMKVVNGIRSFVGRTSDKFIYHELDESDIGSVYYIVVPIMSEFDIDEAGYSSPIVIHPEGLTRKIKKPTMGSSTPLKSLTQESLKNFVPSTVDLSSTTAGNKSGF